MNCRWTVNIHKNYGLVIDFHLPWQKNIDCKSFIIVKSQRHGSRRLRRIRICSNSDLTQKMDLKSSFVTIEYHAKVKYSSLTFIGYHKLNEPNNTFFNKHYLFVTKPSEKFLSISRTGTCNTTLNYKVIMKYHIISWHEITFHTATYHTVPYHMIPYHTIECHTILYTEKTKLLVQHASNQPQNIIPTVQVNTRTVESVPSFSYLGSLLSSVATCEDEIQNHIRAAHVAYGRTTDKASFRKPRN